MGHLLVPNFQCAPKLDLSLLFLIHYQFDVWSLQ